MNRLKMPEGEAIEHPWVTRAIENAQRKVEQRNFDIRKQLLEYDDVSNDQRKVIYEQRNELLASADIGDTIRAMRDDVLNDTISLHIAPGSMDEQWDVAGLEKTLAAQFIARPAAAAMAGRGQDAERGRPAQEDHAKPPTRSTRRRKRWSAPKACASSSAR